jgi:hypothetical protein
MRLLPLFLVWLIGTAHALAALEVKNPRWGFGGKAVLHTFNVFGFEVRNTGSTTFEGKLTLESEGGRNFAAAYERELSLSPGSSKWVQFVPYVESSRPDFTVSWGEGRDDRVKFERLQELGFGPPAIVILADPETLRSTRMGVFTESQFPVTVAATDGLFAVVLDHSPRFLAAQAEAFMDWVRSGGVVHLVPGSTGALPTFSDALLALNVTGDKARVGAGLVMKHAIPVSEIQEKDLEKAKAPMPFEKKGNEYESNRDEDTNDYAMFRTLSGVTKPKIAWWLIYILTGVYVLVIGPVFYVLRKRDYRLLLAGFLGTVALFAWIFTAVGRRGYGESQICHSLAIVRSLGSGRFDVTHWSHAFATSGGLYRLQYPGTSQVYGAPRGQSDTVRGTIQAGAEAYFDADIPLFSFRNFVHRGVMAGDDLGATLSSSGKDQYQITLARSIPGELIRVAVQMNNVFYDVDFAGSGSNVTEFKFSLGKKNGAGASMLNPKGDSDHDYDYDDYTPNQSDALRKLNAFGPKLALRAGANLEKVSKTVGWPTPRDTVRFYAYVRDSDAFRMAGKEFATGKNYVLYIQDFVLP